MTWFLWCVIRTVINTFIIITIVNVILMGGFRLKFSGKCNVSKFLISKKNRIDIQDGYECSGYSTAYVLRHYDLQASGGEIYKKMPNKMSAGYVYPKGIRKLLTTYGFSVKYCAGNLNALQKEISKGNPVIVMIRVRTDKSWLHFVPVVGYDENSIFIAESMAELINCDEQNYNRKISKKDFLKLWNTSMLKMPLYKNTFYVVRKNEREIFLFT